MQCGGFCRTLFTGTRAALQIQDRSPKSRPVASLNQSQTQLTRPVATGLGLQHDPDQGRERAAPVCQGGVGQC